MGGGGRNGLVFHWTPDLATALKLFLVTFTILGYLKFLQTFQVLNMKSVFVVKRS